MSEKKLRISSKSLKKKPSLKNSNIKKNTNKQTKDANNNLKQKKKKQVAAQNQIKASCSFQKMKKAEVNGVIVFLLSETR